MKIGDLIKKIRTEKGITQSRLSDLLGGFTTQFISMIENSERKVSEDFIAEMVEKFPAYKDKLLTLYAVQFLPENLQEEFSGLDTRGTIEKAKDYDLKIYAFNSNGSGKVDLEKFKMEKHTLLIEQWEQIGKNSLSFEVIGNNMDPYFLNGDIIFFSKTEFHSWESLDSSLILVKIRNEFYLRKLFFDDGVPLLHSFNKRLYPPMELDDNAEFIGVLSGQISRDIRELKFK